MRAIIDPNVRRLPPKGTSTTMSASPSLRPGAPLPPTNRRPLRERPNRFCLTTSVPRVMCGARDTSFLEDPGAIHAWRSSTEKRGISVRYQLPNGLTVVFEAQRSAPVVAMHVWIKVGSADETRDEAGLAHLHEHMLFKGTSRRGIGEIAREVEDLGGEINAWTSFDETVYHLVLASAHFSEGLDILADAVRESTFDAGELSREIEVVVEEIKRSDDLPPRRVARGMFETAYRSHPYRWPVLGTVESVRSFTREKMLGFSAKHYAPDNIVVVIVGDVEESFVRAEVERLFGDWKRKRAAIAARASEPPHEEPRVLVVHDGLNEAHIALAFPVPELTAPETPVLDTLAFALGQGEGSRLNLGLKIEKALASAIYAYAYTPRDPGLMIVGATFPPHGVREGIQALLREIRRLQLHPLAGSELEVAKATVEADAIYGRETVEGTARKLGLSEAVAGDLEFEARYYERVRKLTSEEVFAAASRYLDLGRVTVSALLPKEVALSENDLRALLQEALTHEPTPRHTPPTLEAPPARPLKKAPSSKRAIASGIERATLESGAKVLVKAERGAPLVALRAVYPGGLRHEDATTNGISQLASRLLTRSTRTRDASSVARAIDAMAGTLTGNAGRNSLGLRGQFLAKHFEPAMRLFAECLSEPAFVEDEVEKERDVLLQDIRSRDDNPSSAVFQLFAHTLFRVHPYRFDPLGEVVSVQGLTRSSLRGLCGSALSRSGLALAVVGDIEPDAAFSLAEELFAPHAGEAAAFPQVPAEPEQTEPRRAFKLLDKAQAHLVYGFKGTTVRSADRYALDVLSSVLSGQGGRLFVELRDKRSLAYSVSSFSVEGIDPGYFGVYMGTSPEKVRDALRGIREELDVVMNTRLPEADLHRARRYLIGTHAIGLQKSSARAAFIAYDEAYGVGADAYLRYEEQINAVTSDRVLEVARHILAPARGTLAILGPRGADVGFDDA